jgi:hypothetical protein
VPNFVNAQGNSISGQSISVQVGESKEIGLTTPNDAQGQPLTVDVSDTTGQRCIDIASIFPTTTRNGIRFFRVRGLRDGAGRIDATSRAFQVSDTVNLTVGGGSASQIEELVRALDDGTLHINRGDANVIRAVARGSATLAIADEIVQLLNNLLVFGELDVMSMLRRGQSQHGVVDGSRVICKAVDIQGYRNIPVRLRPPATVINLIAEILQRFPAGQFDLGFPRPVGGATGFNPTDDVFFPVPDLDTAGKCWAGTISRPLSAMMQPARDRISMAMGLSRGTFNVFYPDGLNHLHVSVTKYARRVAT